MDDVVIVGGSSAGLSAALILGRSLRKVVVIDDGKPCNRVSHASHGFLTQDGTPPSDLLRIAREQLEHYPTVKLLNSTAVRIEKQESGFAVTTEDTGQLDTRLVLLATGLQDTLPALSGVEAFFGKSVFHCPYCDGYEVHHQPIAVYGTDESVLHQTFLLRNLTDQLTVCTGGAWNLNPEQRQRLARHQIELVEKPVTRLEGNGEQLQAIRFTDGTSMPCQVLFIRPKTEHRTSFAYDLGCALNGQLVQVDVLGRTSAAGVYAAGDLSSPMRSVALAVAQGAAAAYGINFDLITQDLT